MVNVNWPTAVAGEADIVSSVSASACHIGGPIGVNPGELTLVHGRASRKRRTPNLVKGYDVGGEFCGGPLFPHLPLRS